MRREGLSKPLGDLRACRRISLAACFSKSALPPSASPADSINLDRDKVLLGIPHLHPYHHPHPIESCPAGFVIMGSEKMPKSLGK